MLVIGTSEKTKLRHGSRTLSVESLSEKSDSIHSAHFVNTVLALTSSFTRHYNQVSSSPFFFSGHQAELLPILETKTTPTGSLTMLPAFVYYTSPRLPGRPFQCRLCVENRSLCPNVFKGDRDPLIEKREKSFQTRQMEHQHWSPRSRKNQFTVTDNATARIFNTEENPLPADATARRAPVAT